MITGLDHVVLITSALDAGIAAYASVLGRAPSWRASIDGAASAFFSLDNMALELRAPTGEGLSADAIRAALATQGEGLASLCFAVHDIDRAYRAFDRRGLRPEAICDGAGADGDQRLSWKRLRANTEATHGIRQFFIARDQPLPRSQAVAAAPATALDHVVISTGAPDRAAGLYGARLGLDMALDRSNPDWDMRLMFFRCGDLIVEIAHRLSEATNDAPDTFYGLTWRTGDLDATHARLAAAGLNVSNIRTGRKPGSRVFSLKNGTLNVPTLFIGA